MPEVVDAPGIGFVINNGEPVQLRVAGQDPVCFSVTASGGAPVPHYAGALEVTPTEEEQSLETAGFMLDSDLTVHAVDSQYVGSDIPRRDALGVSGPAVTAPSGYYPDDLAVTVDGGSVTMPSPVIIATPTISVDNSGAITASVSASETVTPAVIAGWVTGAESGTVTAQGTATEHLDTVPGGTIVPGNAQQTAIQRGQFATGDIVVDSVHTETQSVTPTTSSQTVTPTADHYLSRVDVGAIPPEYIVPAGTLNITSNGSMDCTAYAEVDVAVPGPVLQSKSKTYTPSTSAQSETISPDAGYDGLSSVSVAVDQMPAGSKGGSATTSVTQDTSYKYYTTAWTNATSGYFAASAWNPAAQVRFQRQTETVTPSTTTQTITPTSAYYYLEKVVVNPIGAPNLQNKSVSYTPTESAQSESITADAGYDGLGTVDVSVGAISPTYVGSGVTQRSSADLSASGDTVTAPAGYYASSASAAVGGGVAAPAASLTGTSANVSIGTNAITLSKTISNTPQVTAGYISAGTAGNTSVSLTGTVPTQGAQIFHPSTTDQSVSGSRYLTAAQTFKAVTLSNLTAENIKNGVTIKVGDSSDDDCVASVTGTYSGGGGSKNIQVAAGVNRVATTSYTAVSGQSLTVSKSGTYDVYWSGYRSSTGGTNGSQLYIAGSAYGTAQTTFSNNGQSVHLSGVSLTQNQTIEVRARARGTSYYMYVSNLTIVEA